jgi:surface polysaccharide O-acyltransferase-like enzyme
MEKITKKINYIDLLKTIAIYSVVTCHFNRISVSFLDGDNHWEYFNYFLKSFFSASVPTFFFVNGMLLLNRKELDIKKHIVKVVNILLLLIIWSVITLIALGYIRNEKLSPMQIVEAVWTFKYGWNNHLWFLKALVIIYFFYPLIYVAFKTNMKIFNFFMGCACLFTFGSVFLHDLIEVVNFAIGRLTESSFQIYNSIYFDPFEGIGGMGFAYFILGGFIFKYRDRLNVKKIRIASIIVLPLSMLFLSLYGVMLSLKNGYIWDNVWNGFATIFTILNVIALFIISMNYKPSKMGGKLVQIIGENSLGIYLLHVVVGNLFMPFFEKTGFSGALPANFLFSFFILLFSLLVVLILKKVPVVKRLFAV